MRPRGSSPRELSALPGRPLDAFGALGGRYDRRTRTWTFPTVAAAANALAEVYRASRASPRAVAIICEMIADGSGAIAWGRLPDRARLRDLDRAVAAGLIIDGYAARAYFGLDR